MGPRLLKLPLLVILIGISAGAMLAPAGLAAATGDTASAAAFAKAALLVAILAAVLGAATLRYRPQNAVRSVFLSLLGAYAVLPPLMALPMAEATPGLAFADAWFEMVSSFTTTGATILVDPANVPMAVHLWNATVGWLGGFFVLLAATALLAPLNLGGLEIESPRPVGRLAFTATPIHFEADSGQRAVASLRVLAPAYAGITAVLWIALMASGSAPFVGLCHAMGVLATSGISPVGGLESGGAGRIGEVLVLLAFVFAVTRRSLPGAPQTGRRRAFHRDPELRLALFCILGMTLLLLLRHAAAAVVEPPVQTGLAALLSAVWGTVFTLASFLVTAGYVSADWAGAEALLRLGTPGLLLAGFALIGGGVATTAGGIRLLRVLALVRQGQHEMHMLLQPSLVAGGGRRARHLRSDGAYLGWVAFMLFVVSLAIAVAALALGGLSFEDALLLAIAALTTTGPLLAAAAEPGLSFAGLDGTQKAITAVVMVFGRLELLALVALLVPESWRR